MTTLHIHSTGLIYSPGLFRWIVEGFKRDKPKARELLLALGVPTEYVAPILAGKYQQHTEGETLVITL
jgi:hypothetical protein